MWEWAAPAAAVAAAGLGLQWARFARYRCPDRGRLLAPPDRAPGRPIEYYCPACGVVWETGFRTPRSADG